MYFDALTLAAVVDDLRATIVGGRVQRVLLTTPLSVALEVYSGRRRHHLLLSAHPQLARVSLLGERPSRGVEGSPHLLLLLRKYVLGGRITAVEQPDLERIVLLSIVKGPAARNTDADEPLPEDAEDVDEEQRSELVAEVMDRRSNIVLVGDDNIIRASVKHVSPLMSRRPVQPHEPYELPPRQDKLDPRRATPQGLRTLSTPEPAPDLARALVGMYRGLSPQAAREAVFRAVGRAAAQATPDLPWDALAESIHAVVAERRPCLALGEHGPLAYAPYLLTHYERVEELPSISTALERFYASREHVTSHQQRRDALEAALGESRGRLDRQRHQLEEQMKQAESLDRLRWEGEMIYAFLHTIRPGQTALDVEGQSITIDPALSPVENAQARFRSYDKAKGAVANVPELLAGVKARLAGLDETLVLLRLADTYEQIEDIAREAAEQGYLKSDGGRKRAKVRRQPPLRLQSSEGFAIYVGRSAGQNEHVTFQIAAPDDLWLHVRNIPGAHVVVKSGGADVSDATLEQAAGLAAYYSAARADAAVDVEMARRRLVRRVPGGPAGLVTYRAERTLRVAPLADKP